MCAANQPLMTPELVLLIESSIVSYGTHIYHLSPHHGA
jgi:hypothetical protein